MFDRARIAPSADAQTEAIVTTRGLRKSYDRRAEILKGIDLTIRRGERVALIGSNGSGKSTLLRCLIGLNDLTAGEVTALGETFTGRPARAQKARLRGQTGFVFQKHCLVRRRSVLSNVIHGLLSEPGSWRAFSQSTARETWRNSALEALDSVNLRDKAAARADALSGGQQQRVAIARALVRRPLLLIADEPAASLDPVSGQDVMALFSRLCVEHGITLLFTTHDMNHARNHADRIVALKAGAVLLDRPAAEVTDADFEEVFRVQPH